MPIVTYLQQRSCQAAPYWSPDPVPIYPLPLSALKLSKAGRTGEQTVEEGSSESGAKKPPRSPLAVFLEGTCPPECCQPHPPPEDPQVPQPPPTGCRLLKTKLWLPGP